MSLVDENNLGLSSRGLVVGGMNGLGGGNTYTYRTALYGTFPGRTGFSVLPSVLQSSATVLTKSSSAVLV